MGEYRRFWPRMRWAGRFSDAVAAELPRRLRDPPTRDITDSIMMRRIHIAIAVRDYAASIGDYTRRFGVGPRCTVQGQYALWGTNTVNFSISVGGDAPGSVRHLGFEEPGPDKMTATSDVNAITWVRFAWSHQKAEILER